MRKIILLLTLTSLLMGWGKTGHRIVGKIAQDQLSPDAVEEITKILGHADLSRVSDWADEIKSDDSWDHAYDWHYCTIPAGETWKAGEHDGKLPEKIEEFRKVLKSRRSTPEEKEIALKFLVHLVGDIHQPLHVGNGTDRGGNDVKVEWFRESSNLHRVWDSGLIEHQQLSYTEYAHYLMLTTTGEEIVKWQSDDLQSIMAESQSYHSGLYDIGDGKLSWDYVAAHKTDVEERLLRAGVRLGGMLNEIYD